MKHCHLKSCKQKGVTPTIVGDDVWWYCKKHSYLAEANEKITEIAPKIMKEAIDFAKWLSEVEK